MGAIARRQFLIGASAVLAAPIVLRAQVRPPHRIGLLPDHYGAYLAWFHEAMRRHGWREGREFALLQPGLLFGDSYDEAARRVVSGRPDIILTVGTHYALAARRLTTRIPTVVWSSGYPVETGLAESLSRPGKNVTGNAAYAGTLIWGKLLELLRDVRPEAKRVGELMCYVPPFHPQVETDLIYRDLRNGADRLGLAIHFTPLAQADQVDAALRDLDASSPDVVVLTTGLGVWPVRQKVLGFALERRWPTITDVHWDPDDALQPLMSYGPSMRLLNREAVDYVVRILRDGAKPADLPMQQPAKFELSINLGTAKALGLAVPPSISCARTASSNERALSIPAPGARSTLASRGRPAPGWRGTRS
jgi:putative ABC transport system substrate-binding protein